jgi:hypothetical protein
MFHIFFVCGKDTKVDALIVKLDVDVGCYFFICFLFKFFFNKRCFFQKIDLTTSPY